MITKFLVLLAVGSQISACKYSQESINYAINEQSIANKNYKFAYPTAKDKYQRIITTSGQKPSSSLAQNIGFVAPSVSTSPTTRNFVIRGKYPVALQNCGPTLEKKIPVVTSHVRAPLQEKPTVRLPTKIPAPKTVAHSCTCFRTIIKPRIQQHIITVPSIQRYIETMHKPVIENIHYEAYPIKCLETTKVEDLEKKEKTPVQTFQVQPVDVSTISGVQMTDTSKETFKTQAFEFPNTQTEEVQLIKLPRFQVSESQESRSIEIPRVQFVEQQQAREIKIPRFHFSENQKPQTVEVPHRMELPRVQFVESQKPETFEIPTTRFSVSKKPQIVEFLQAQKLQTLEIPRIRMPESPTVQNVEIPHQSRTDTYGTSPYEYHFNQ